jgi:hypothetical protein
MVKAHSQQYDFLVHIVCKTKMSTIVKLHSKQKVCFTLISTDGWRWALVGNVKLYYVQNAWRLYAIRKNWATSPDKKSCLPSSEGGRD